MASISALEHRSRRHHYGLIWRTKARQPLKKVLSTVENMRFTARMFRVLEVQDFGRPSFGSIVGGSIIAVARHCSSLSPQSTFVLR